MTLTNCIVWNNATEGVRLSPGCDITYTYSNILSDPLFVDAENGDFRLQSGSPCIGTGEGGADMGAFGWITTDSNNSVVFPLVYLRQNTPNPFNPTTTIAFTLANDGVVSLRVYNALGQQVRTLVNRHTTAGHHTVTWNGRDDRGNAVASGVYLYRLVTGDKVMVKRMTLVR